MIVLGLWFLMQIGSAALTPADQPGIAFWAHVGGFVAGLLLGRAFEDPQLVAERRALAAGRRALRAW